MSKKPAKAEPTRPAGAQLFARLEKRRRRVLFLPRFIAEVSDPVHLQGKNRDRAYEIICKWADLGASKGDRSRRFRTAMAAVPVVMTSLHRHADTRRRPGVPTRAGPVLS
jgi:hypothetical protein